MIACVTAPQPRPRAEDPDGLKWFAARVVADEMKHSGADSVAVVFVNRRGIVWSQMYGAATLDAKMRVGSLSKLMTSLTALSLRDDGLLDLDKPVTDVLPWFSVRSRFPDGGAAGVTPRLIMDHHSGLPSNILKGMYGTSRTYVDHAKALADEDMAHPPGMVFNYSDAAFTLLGTAVEAAGKAPFAELVQKRTFASIGMTSSSFVPTRDVMPAVVDGAPFVENPPATVPANGLVTTPRDVARVAQFLLAGEDPRVKEAMTPHDHTPLDLDFRTGFGLNENDAFARDVDGAPRLFWHSGQTLAFTAELLVCPDKDFGVVVMTNTREAGLLPSTVAWEIAGAYLGVKPSPPAPSSTAFTAEELDSYAGMYPTEYGAIRVARDGGTLRGRAFDEAFELVPTARRTFIPYVLVLGAVPYQPDLLRGVELSFDDIALPGASAPVRALISHQRGLRVLRGTRVDPPRAAIPAAWLARVGHWENPEQGDDQITVAGADVSVDGDGFLVARIHITHSPKPILVVLDAIDDDTAVTAGLGRYLSEVTRVTHEGGAEHLHVVGYGLVRPSGE